MTLNLPHRHAASVKRQNLVVEARPAGLVLGNQLRLEAAVASLDDDDREVILMRFGLMDGRAYTLEEVARCFQVTRERVRQIEQKSLKG